MFTKYIYAFYFIWRYLIAYLCRNGYNLITFDISNYYTNKKKNKMCPIFL